MGLAERRAVKAFQDNKYPKIKSEIDSAAGFDVPLEVQWEGLAAEDYSQYYDEYFVKVYFKPLTEALKAIAIDDMGKEALRDGLKKVVIRHTGSSEASFSNGTFTIDHSPNSNVDYWEDRRKEWQTLLEKGL
jgi:hypothetical protein